MNEQESIAAIHRHLTRRYPMYQGNLGFEEWLLSKAGTDEGKIDQYLALLESYGYLNGEGTLDAAYATLPDPDGVMRDIETRLARLSPETVELLRMGSIEGTQFSGEVLAALKGDAVQGVASALEPAISAGVIKSLGPEPQYSGFSHRYAFRPQQTRDVLYGSIPGEERARLHAALVEFLSREVEKVTEPGAVEMLRAMIDEHHAGAARPDGATTGIA